MTSTNTKVISTYEEEIAQHAHVNVQLLEIEGTRPEPQDRFNEKLEPALLFRSRLLKLRKTPGNL